MGKVVGGPPSGHRPLFDLPRTVLIAAVLVVPFGVSRVVGEEPFPAVIFPGGGMTLAVEHGTTGFDTITLIGTDSMGAEVEMRPDRFLDPIPAWFLKALTASSFGQDRAEHTTLTVKGAGWEIRVPRSRPSPEEQREIERFFAARLEVLGLRTDGFLVRIEHLTVDHGDGEVIDRVTTEEQFVVLD